MTPPVLNVLNINSVQRFRRSIQTDRQTNGRTDSHDPHTKRFLFCSPQLHDSATSNIFYANTECSSINVTFLCRNCSCHQHRRAMRCGRTLQFPYILIFISSTGQIPGSWEKKILNLPWLNSALTDSSK